MGELQRHYANVAALGCIACKLMGMGFSVAEIHHPYGRKGKNEMRVIPICYSHHRGQVNNKLWVSVHPWGREFYARYGAKAALLAQVDKLLEKTH